MMYDHSNCQVLTVVWYHVDIRLTSTDIDVQVYQSLLRLKTVLTDRDVQ